MKLHRIAMAAVACAPFLASAQSSVTLYGIADLGIRHTSGMTAANAPGPSSATGIASGVDNTSRFGLRGREDLGGGLHAVFNLETGLNLDTGTQANATKFFDRAAIVGLGGAWGTVTAGRQTNLLADAISPVDPVGMRFASFNPNIATTALSSHGLGIEYGSAGATNGSYRLDNALKYVGRFGPVTARAMYGFGENAAGANLQSSRGAGLAYAAGGLTVSGAYQNFKSPAGLALDAATLGVAYQFGSVRLMANTGRSKAETSATARTVHRVHSVGGTWAATPAVDLTASVYRLDRDRSGLQGDGYTRAILFAEYKLSRRSRLYAELDRTNWRDGYQGAANKSAATGITAGVIHTF
ncbi:porin [Paracidovorax avenae]|uniref:porin n=1 Tax=Paracidovorax avenae TaxID=80867 RepID=UPI000D178190|nr:porin [Paracidovorax avenae]AVS70412.1 porin [Paracidovorax avenae]